MRINIRCENCEYDLSMDFFYEGGRIKVGLQPNPEMGENWEVNSVALSLSKKFTAGCKCGQTELTYDDIYKEIIRDTNLNKLLNEEDEEKV